jgi:hypothetical protein
MHGLQQDREIVLANVITISPLTGAAKDFLE